MRKFRRTYETCNERLNVNQKLRKKIKIQEDANKKKWKNTAYVVFNSADIHFINYNLDNCKNENGEQNSFCDNCNNFIWIIDCSLSVYLSRQGNREEDKKIIIQNKNENFKTVKG